MGYRIAVDMYFTQSNHGIDTLRAAVSCGGFTARAIGVVGILPKGSTKRTVGVVGGWGAEDFTRYDRDIVNEITVIASSEQNHKYLESFVSFTRRNEDLSPFEETVPRYGATLLASPPLDPNILDVCNERIRSLQRPNIWLYGTFRLSVRDPGPWDWSNAWRTIGHLGSEDEPADRRPIIMRPFISLWTHPTLDESDITWLTLYSNSSVWLREAGGLHGHIGPDEADENLRNLAQLAGALANNGRAPLRNATLTLDGDPFWREAERIQEVFAQVLPFTYEL